MPLAGLQPTLGPARQGNKPVLRGLVGLVFGALALALAPAPCAAQATYVAGGRPQFETAGVSSFVPDSTGATVWDTAYGTQVRAFAGSFIDIVMQQCFSGGFADEIDSNLAGVFGYTFTASANWNETAKNDIGKGFLGLQSLTRLDNFTRAWVDGFPRNTGLLQHYTDATFGRGTPPAVIRDPFAPGGRLQTQTNFENPVFGSPDALLPNGNFDRNGPNNGRDVVTANTYAILVGWGAISDRHEANINRVYDALLGISIPVANIVVLDGAKARGTSTAAFPNLGLLGHFVDGPTTVANWNAALAGALFAGVAPNASSRLLVYNTGHGGSWDANAGRSTVARTSMNVVIDGYFDTASEPSDLADGVVATSDSGDTVLLQLSTRAPLDAGAQVIIDGVAVGTPQLVVDPLQIVDLSFQLGTTHSYQLRFAMSVIGASATGAPIFLQIDNLLNPALDLLAAVTFKGGDQTFAAGVSAVPEAAAWLQWLAGLGVLTAFRWRCRSPDAGWRR